MNMSLLALLANVNCFHRDNMKTLEGGGEENRLNQSRLLIVDLWCDERKSKEN